MNLNYISFNFRFGAYFEFIQISSKFILIWILNFYLTFYCRIHGNRTSRRFLRESATIFTSRWRHWRFWTEFYLPWRLHQLVHIVLSRWPLRQLRRILKVSKNCVLLCKLLPRVRQFVNSPQKC